MNEYLAAGSASHADDAARDAAHEQESRAVTDDELVRRITRALRSRDAAEPDVATHVDRIEARLAEVSGGPRPAAPTQDEQLASVTSLARRGGKVVAAGVVISALAVYGAGAAAAANPYSGGARAVENLAQAVGISWSAMPDGYTRAQYEAFWGAGYTAGDVDTLSALWSTGTTETKARAGQLILDGADLPITPGIGAVTAQEPGPDGAPTTLDYTQAEYDAFWGAGYTSDDVTTLSELWKSDATETKAHAGRLILDGEALPISPGSAASDSARN
ncbi:hypothetical protein [Pengzhenrongella phosphoraccumulans]|uniref:hypothetical protein n=1 Tax=Pengzhenrongella phosphoraccumulans TaxID=3114394 RepID=UPI00389084CC